MEVFTYNKKHGIYLIIFCIAYIIFSFLTLDISPAPFYAEPWMVEPTWNLLNFGELDCKLSGDWRVKGELVLGQGIFEYLSFVPFLKIFEVTPFSYRLPSIMSALLMLYYSFSFGKLLGGKYTTLFSVLFVTASIAFFSASHTARASIHLGTLHVMMVYFLYKFRISNNKSSKYAILSAIFGALPVFFHWSGICVSLAGFICFFVNQYRHKSTLKVLTSYLLTTFVMIILWIYITSLYIELDFFWDQVKLIINGNNTQDHSPVWKNGGVFYFYFLGIQKGSNILELALFLFSIIIIVKAKLDSFFLLKYFFIFILSSLFFYEQASLHKAAVFTPVMMLCCAHALNYFLSRLKKRKLTSLSLVAKYMIIIFLAVSFIKQGLMVKRHYKADYYGNIARVKKHIPENVKVLGDMHYWPGLVGRNNLLGGTFFLGRVINGWSTNDESTYEFTMNFFRLLQDLNVDYIIMDDAIRGQFVDNGLFEYGLSDTFMEKIAHFTENYYATFIHEKKGDIDIYRLNYSKELGPIDDSFLKIKTILKSSNNKKM